MRNVAFLCLLALAVFSSTGCTSLSRADEVRLRELNAVGIQDTEVKVKHPGVAGGLNLLPGFGNFYLGIGTNEGAQWTYGFLNLLFWPASVIWGVPQGAIDANTINKKETVYYYTYDPHGKKEFKQLEASLADQMLDEQASL
ncbi:MULTISPECIES: hypothetical protein [unclassified Alcanivorax]|mgnify:CR=1|jgi:hypothetical protein|uniref:hypothetical protein n=1 Tax=unclassified Alcanivorax TaxID=2638842 RepID=UPI0007B93B17|nr:MULTISPECIES: hypothetical protein [unclassified Alcanivorax]KZX75383.1 hypothetical protein A3717_02435 [Alcanivorax sp. HI0013]KZX76735.1 hypothetical protein A3716_01465 [Alcanivorax sp. HI0011]KZY12475.1 hypothetical protein A3725_21945 [Alcanivorax sp. HI0035]MEE2602956.1 hypothetical protein [Pseudomonadota bacterium]KZX69072.1 hypothetical protein A3713_01705 [Alcanivorax sp. HI0003]|tara:strand:- start:396 stop:821 length:426 start_codon:yes stop_codon:yes gene_type:complete